MLKAGALALLSTYGGDSSDDDVPDGSRILTKRLHKEDDEEPQEKRLKRLPLPNLLLGNEIKHVDEHTDDPSLHHGRIRTFKHERGNWATYVYVPYDGHKGIKELISSMQIILAENISIKEAENFHISLTRTVVLKYHWINLFIDSLKVSTSHCKKFIILFDNLKVYCNEERSRTFIGLQIKTGYDSLMKLVELLDKCLNEFNLPPFYENPSFHMSIAWCVGDFEEELNLILPQLNHQLQELKDRAKDHFQTISIFYFSKNDHDKVRRKLKKRFENALAVPEINNLGVVVLSDEPNKQVIIGPIFQC